MQRGEHKEQKNLHSIHRSKLDQSLCQYLKIPRSELLRTENKLHLNFTKHITTLSTAKLVKWLKLISTERSATIQLKRKVRYKNKKGQRTITNFFKLNSAQVAAVPEI